MDKIFTRLLNKYKIYKLRFSIIFILLLLLFSVSYFFISARSNQTTVYVRTILQRPITVVVNAPYNNVPFWLSESIKIGDFDTSLLGGTHAEVIDKEIYELPNFGQTVYLTIKVNAVKDRSGILLYRNKPLAVGSVIDLNLSKSQVSGLVTQVSNSLPKNDKTKLRVLIKGKAADDQVFDIIKVGDKAINNKGEIFAEVVDKKQLPSKSLVLDIIRSQYDYLITVDLTVDRIGDTYYFLDLNKIKANEYISLSFPNYSFIAYQIVSFSQL